MSEMKDEKKTKTQLIKELIKARRQIAGLRGAQAGRKRAEEALRVSEKKLKEAQRIAHLGFWDLNVVTGSLYWSDETHRIYGFEPQEFVPTLEKFQAILHPDDIERIQAAVDAALSGDAEYDIDFRFTRPDGEIGWIHCKGEVTRDDEGKPIRFFGIQIDTTEQKQAEEKLRIKDIAFAERASAKDWRLRGVVDDHSIKSTNNRGLRGRRPAADKRA